MLQNSPGLNISKVKVYSRIRHWLGSHSTVGGRPPRVPRNTKSDRQGGVKLVAQVKRLLESGALEEPKWPVESGGYRIEVEAWHACPDSLARIVDMAQPLLTLEGLNTVLKGLDSGEGYVQITSYDVQLAAYRAQLQHLIPLCLLMSSVGLAGGGWPHTLEEQLRKSQQRAVTLRKLWVACVDEELPPSGTDSEVPEDGEDPGPPLEGERVDDGDSDPDLGGPPPFQPKPQPARPPRPVHLDLRTCPIDLDVALQDGEAAVANIIAHALWHQSKPVGKASTKVSGMLWNLSDKAGRAIAKGCYTRHEAIARALCIFPDLLSVSATSDGSEGYSWRKYMREAGRELPARVALAAEDGVLKASVQRITPLFKWVQHASQQQAGRGEAALSAASAAGYHPEQRFTCWRVTSLTGLQLATFPTVRTREEVKFVYQVSLLVEGKSFRLESWRQKKTKKT